MLRQLVKDGSVYTLGTLLTSGLSIFLVPFYTRVLSPSEYGIIDLMLVFGSFVNVSIALEISQGFARFYPDATSNEEKVRLSSTAFWFTCGAYIVFSSIALLFSRFFSQLILSSTQWRPIFFAGVVAIACNGIYSFMQSQFRWQLQSRKYAINSLVFMITNIGCASYLILRERIGAIGIFYGQIIGACVAGILAWYLNRNNFRLMFSMASLKKMLNFSTPLVPSSISVIVAQYIDRIAIKNLMTLRDVGLYGIGYRISSIANLTMTGFKSAIVPLTYSHYKNPSTPSEMERIFRYFLAIAMPACMALSTFAHEILWVFAPKNYYSAWSVIPLMSAATLFANMYIFAPGLAIANKTKTVAGISISSAIINTILNFVLIPIFGIAGAALATLLGSLLSFLLYVVLGQKFYPLPYQSRKIISASCLTLIIIIANVIFFPKTPSVCEITFFIKPIIIIAASIGTGLILIDQIEIKWLQGKLINIFHGHQ
jgi:O-antigen/teichoic acid export membrane protein